MEIEKKKGNKADPHQAREFTTVCTSFLIKKLTDGMLSHFECTKQIIDYLETTDSIRKLTELFTSNQLSMFQSLKIGTLNEIRTTLAGQLISCLESQENSKGNPRKNNDYKAFIDKLKKIIILVGKPDLAKEEESSNTMKRFKPNPIRA